MGRQRQGTGRPGVRQVPEGSGEQGKVEKKWLQNHLGAPTTLAVEGLMMGMMKMMMMLLLFAIERCCQFKGEIIFPNTYCQFGLVFVSCFLICSFDMFKYIFLVSLCSV